MLERCHRRVRVFIPVAIERTTRPGSYFPGCQLDLLWRRCRTGDCWTVASPAADRIQSHDSAALREQRFVRKPAGERSNHWAAANRISYRTLIDQIERRVAASGLGIPMISPSWRSGCFGWPWHSAPGQREPETDCQKEATYEHLLDLIARLVARRWLEEKSQETKGTSREKKAARTREELIESDGQIIITKRVVKECYPSVSPSLGSATDGRRTDFFHR